MKSMNKVLGYMRKKWYLPLSFAVMLLSFFVNAPTGEMIVSLEWNGLTMIFIMALSVAGLMKEKTLSPLKIASDAFEHMGAILLWFIALGFVLSAFITSIAASLFLIPLAINLLEKKERKEQIPGTVAAIAISANAGGLLLPSGSIQNMLLHRAIEADSSFIMTMLPFFLISIPALLLMIPAVLGKKTMERVYIHGEYDEDEVGTKGMRMLYVCLIAVAVLSSFGLFKWFVILLVTLIILFVFDRSVFIRTDYSIFLSILFLTIAGNSFDAGTVSIMKSTLLSEVIGSGAAAAFLLPSADNVSNLLIGSNIGAFGTVISAPALIALHSMMKRGKKDSLIFTAYYTGASVLFIALSSLYINLILNLMLAVFCGHSALHAKAMNFIH